MRSVFILTIALLSILLVLVLEPFQFFDFSRIWKASQLLVQGGNPYELPHYASFLIDSPPDLIPDPNSVNPGFYWLPFPFVIFFPFGFFSLAVAKRLFFILSLLGFSWACLTCQKLFIRPQPAHSINWHTVLLLLVTIPFGIFYHGITMGSASWIMLVAILSFFLFFEHQKYLLAGACFYPLLMKPHLFGPFFAVLLAWSLLKKNFLIIFGFILSIIAGSCVLLLLEPKIFSMFYALLEVDKPLSFVNATLPNLLNWYLEGEWPAFTMMVLPFLAAAGTLLASLYFKVYNLKQALTYVLPFSLILAPYAWGHDYILCMPLLFVAADYILNNHKHLGLMRGKVLYFFIFVSNFSVLALAIKFWVPGWSYILYGLGLCSVMILLINDKQQEWR